MRRTTSNWSHGASIVTLNNTDAITSPTQQLGGHDHRGRDTQPKSSPISNRTGARVSTLLGVAAVSAIAGATLYHTMRNDRDGGRGSDRTQRRGRDEDPEDRRSTRGPARSLDHEWSRNCNRPYGKSQGRAPLPQTDPVSGPSRRRLTFRQLSSALTEKDAHGSTDPYRRRHMDAFERSHAPVTRPPPAIQGCNELDMSSAVPGRRGLRNDRLRLRPRTQSEAGSSRVPLPIETRTCRDDSYYLARNQVSVSRSPEKFRDGYPPEWRRDAWAPVPEHLVGPRRAAFPTTSILRTRALREQPPHTEWLDDMRDPWGAVAIRSSPRSMQPVTTRYAPDERRLINGPFSHRDEPRYLTFAGLSATQDRWDNDVDSIRPDDSISCAAARRD